MRTVQLVVLFAVLLAGIGCGYRNARITVGSKTGTEQTILGEIIVQHLERRLGRPVDRRLSIGGIDLLHQAMVSGEIDVYPEYTGTALRSVLRFEMASDRQAVYFRVRDVYKSEYRMTWLPPLGFDSAFALAVRPADAEKLQLTTISEAARKEDGWKLGYADDFASRPDGLPLLTSAYRIQFRAAPALLIQGQLYSALRDGMVDIIAAHTTDASAIPKQVTLLADDRKVFPPYQACVVMRDAALDSNATLEKALRELSGRIDNATMQRMNAEVDFKRRPPADVAREFLAK